MLAQTKLIGVVIPCYKVSTHICDLIRRVGDEVAIIIVVDDCCPEKSGALVATTCTDPRVRIVYHQTNQGVGGAVLTGYQTAIEAGADVIVKIDGDGQMDPALIPAFIAPILCGEADYTKDNRFFEIETILQMPLMRIIGNAGLAFVPSFLRGTGIYLIPPMATRRLVPRWRSGYQLRKLAVGISSRATCCFA